MFLGCATLKYEKIETIQTKKYKITKTISLIEFADLLKSKSQEIWKAEKGFCRLQFNDEKMILKKDLPKFKEDRQEIMGVHTKKVELSNINSNFSLNIKKHNTKNNERAKLVYVKMYIFNTSEAYYLFIIGNQEEYFAETETNTLTQINKSLLNEIDLLIKKLQQNLEVTIINH